MMKKIGKRMIACVLLVTTLMCGAMTVFAADGCNHQWVNNSEQKTHYETYSSIEYHTKVTPFDRSCTECGVREVGESRVTERHDFYLYDNLGHQDGYHKYRIYCRACNESHVVTLTCDNVNGHSTPWSFEEKVEF